MFIYYAFFLTKIIYEKNSLLVTDNQWYDSCICRSVYVSSSLVLGYVCSKMSNLTETPNEPILYELLEYFVRQQEPELIVSLEIFNNYFMKKCIWSCIKL